MRVVANSLSPWMPVETPLGGGGIKSSSRFCHSGFLFFLLAWQHKETMRKKYSPNWKGPLLSVLPNHTQVKKFADNMSRSDKLAESFGAVAVHVDDYSQLAFKIEREPNGNVAVYLSSVRPTPGWVR